jgi:hypothetical protein
MLATTLSNRQPTAAGAATSFVELEEMLGDGFVGRVVLAGDVKAVLCTSKNKPKEF